MQNFRNLKGLGKSTPVDAAYLCVNEAVPEGRAVRHYKSDAAVFRIDWNEHCRGLLQKG